MLRHFFITMLLVLIMKAPAYAQFPRQGVAGITNGQSSPFAGAWEVGFPEGEGMINGSPPVTCQAPVLLQPAGDQDLVYVSPKGQTVDFELSAFSERTVWLPAAGSSIVIVWVSLDEFFSYTVDLATGRAGWEDPRVYRRCS